MTTPEARPDETDEERMWRWRGLLPCDRHDPCAYDNTCRVHKAFATIHDEFRAQLAARDEAGRRMLAILVRATVAEDPDEWLADAHAFTAAAPPTWRETT